MSVISEKDAVRGRTLFSIAAVIEAKDNTILLMREGDLPYHDCWVIPGGYVKPDETVKQAVVREVKEETGLEVIPKEFLGLYDDFLSEEEPTHHIIAAYKAMVIGGRVIFTREATKYAWMNPEEVIKSDDVPDVFKRIVKDFTKRKPNGLISRVNKFLEAHFQRAR